MALMTLRLNSDLLQLSGTTGLHIQILIRSMSGTSFYSELGDGSRNDCVLTDQHELDFGLLSVLGNDPGVLMHHKMLWYQWKETHQVIGEKSITTNHLVIDQFPTTPHPECFIIDLTSFFSARKN